MSHGWSRPVEAVFLMSTSIPSEFQSFVTSLIASRRFLTEQEVLAEGLRLLKQRISIVEEVQSGFEQIEDGAFVDGTSALEHLKQSLTERGQ